MRRAHECSQVVEVHGPLIVKSHDRTPNSPCPFPIPVPIANPQVYAEASGPVPQEEAGPPAAPEEEVGPDQV